MLHHDTHCPLRGHGRCCQADGVAVRPCRYKVHVLDVLPLGATFDTWKLSWRGITKTGKKLKKPQAGLALPPPVLVDLFSAYYVSST